MLDQLIQTDERMTIPRLAAATTYSRQYVWEVATGRKRANAEVAEACDRALDAAGALVAAWQRPDAVDRPVVNRRQLIIDMAALGLAAPLAATETVRHGLMAALGGRDAVDVDEWTAIAVDYGRSFYSTPPDRLLRDLTADLEVLRRCLPAVTGTAERDLHRVAGQLAAVTALAYASIGEQRHARRWWGTARSAADRSTDLDTRVWVRGWEVADGLYERRPVKSILARAEESCVVAGDTVSVGAAGLYAGLAQTMAVGGRAEEAIAALARVEAIGELLPSDVVSDEDSMFGWPEVRLRHTESYVYTWLGDTARAHEAQDRALALYPEALVRERAAMLFHRATCMIHDGDVSGGLTYAAGILDDLPTEHHTDLVYAVARTMIASVPRPERGRPDARELTARLAIAGAAQ